MAESVFMRQSLRIEWKVKNIFSVNNLESEFSFGGSKYELLLQRYGSGENERIVIHMSRINSNETQLHGITVKTYIEGKNRNLMFLFQGINSSKDYILWSKYTSDLRKNEGKILMDGVVTFVCELTTEKTTSKHKTEREVSTQTTEDMDPLPCFECLSLDLQHLLDDSLLSDVTLKCGDRTIPAHRNILSARSDVFLAMFRSDMAESRTGIIEIPYAEPPILDQLLQFLYCCKLPDMTMDTAPQLYEVADKYGVESLKTVCSAFMTENLTEGNACSILLLADSHSDRDLKDSVVSFIVRTKLCKKDEIWLKFYKDHPILAVEVLNRVCKSLS